MARDERFAQQNLDAGRIHFARADQIKGAPAGWDIPWGTEQAVQVMPVTLNFCFIGSTNFAANSE